jgi:purine-binding chemotaxis protein CheW
MNTEATKLVNFKLGEDLFAADIFAVERVLRYKAARTLPDVPSWIEGVIEYQKRVIPVVNLRRRFELAEREPAPETRIIVLNAHGDWIGIVVDSVKSRRWTPATSRRRPHSFAGWRVSTSRASCGAARANDW